MSRARLKKGQAVYLLHDQSGLLRGLMPDTDGQLVYLEPVPPANRLQKPKARLGLPGGVPFMDGSTTVDVPAAIVVLVPKAEQIAEEQELLQKYPTRSMGGRR